MNDTASRSARYERSNVDASILRSLTVGMAGRKVEGGKREHNHTVLRETQAKVRAREARLTPLSSKRTENVRRGAYRGLFALLFCDSLAPGRPAVKSRVYTTLRVNVGTSTSINSIEVTPQPIP